jgi:hypothetical protein
MGADLSKVSVLARREIEARILGPLVGAFCKEFGEERTMQILREVIHSLARQAGVQLADLMGGNTIGHFAKGLELWTKEDALEIEVINQSESEFSFRVLRCRYADIYKELDIVELGKVISCDRDYCLIEGFNPKIELIRSQTIMDGSSSCEFLYRLKD